LTPILPFDTHKLIFYLNSNILLRKVGVKWYLFGNGSVKVKTHNGLFSLTFWLARTPDMI